jgi:hypothetical protein
MRAGQHADGLLVHSSIASHHVLHLHQSAYARASELVWIAWLESLYRLGKFVHFGSTEERPRGVSGNPWFSEVPVQGGLARLGAAEWAEAESRRLEFGCIEGNAGHSRSPGDNRIRTRA